jgi:signal transduction histidine kinase
LHFSVSNTGIEIALEEKVRIFDKFYRIPNNDPWKYSGTGLGLALTRKLVEHMGGTIEVPNANHVTRFTVILPWVLGVMGDG